MSKHAPWKRRAKKRAREELWNSVELKEHTRAEEAERLTSWIVEEVYERSSGQAVAVTALLTAALHITKSARNLDHDEAINELVELLRV